MQQLLGWFRRRDSLIVEQKRIVRVIDFGPESVTLTIEEPRGYVVGDVSVGFEWVPLTLGLEVQYDGQWPDRRSPTHTMAGIRFRDIDKVDVRQHSFGGVPVRGARRIGKEDKGEEDKGKG